MDVSLFYFLLNQRSAVIFGCREDSFSRASAEVELLEHENWHPMCSGFV
jgi:hypothetical protein